MDRKGRQKNAGAASAGGFWGFAILGAWVMSAIALASFAYPAPDPAEQTLAAVHECMIRTPAPWPDAWRQEYIETIRRAIVPDPNTSEYARRLQILRDGFPLYWTVQKFTPERFHFEVRRAEIRWYVENLMDANLPGAEETARLRRQYEDLADHAAAGLLAQFSFLDPNIVQKAKADDLADCYRNIDAPLIPIYLVLLSETQMGEMKQGWQDLRYARVDLWRSLGGHGVAESDDPASPPVSAKPLSEHPDYLLTRQSLDQFRGQFWSVVPGLPDYYRDAVSKAKAAREQWLRARADARRQEDRLGMPVLQTEYLSFLLAALLETAEVSQDRAEK